MFDNKHIIQSLEETFNLKNTQITEFKYLDNGYKISNKNNCLELYITDEKIKVLNLSKCNGYSGKSLLTRLETFAKKITSAKLNFWTHPK